MELAEIKHIECDFCPKEGGARQWHPHGEWKPGRVPDLQGNPVEVYWCAAQWRAYHQIINEVIQLSNQQREVAMQDSNDLTKALTDIQNVAKDLHGLMEAHLPPTMKAQAAMLKLEQAIKEGCDALREFYGKAGVQ